MRVAYSAHTLRFAIPARTSRGALSEHNIYLIKLWREEESDIFGIGECAPLPGLSEEQLESLPKELHRLAPKLSAFDTPEEALHSREDWQKSLPPSLCFATEVALMDLARGGQRRLFAQNSFLSGTAIPINGLIWMGDSAYMWQQVEEKVQLGFNCLKLKVGSLRFDEECKLLARIRKTYGSRLLLRLDANGAFSPSEALDRLEKLAEYGVHSIEQPLAPAQREACAELCARSPIPIALDESLIGLSVEKQADELLDVLQPQYLVLKPTLLGGLSSCRQWIAKAEARGVGWWLTSALESNLGLSAIAQFSASLPGSRIEGLGTGQIYLNNLPSPLQIDKGRLFYRDPSAWQLDHLVFRSL